MNHRPSHYPALQYAFIMAFRILKNWTSLVLFYVIIMEMTLLIFGYSFNFNLFHADQRTCRDQIRECQTPYIQTGIVTGKSCSVSCKQPILITLENYHDHNFFTRMIDQYYEGTL